MHASHFLVFLTVGLAAAVPAAIPGRMLSGEVARDVCQCSVNNITVQCNNGVCTKSVNGGAPQALPGVSDCICIRLDGASGNNTVGQDGQDGAYCRNRQGGQDGGNGTDTNGGNNNGYNNGQNNGGENNGQGNDGSNNGNNNGNNNEDGSGNGNGFGNGNDGDNNGNNNGNGNGK